MYGYSVLLTDTKWRSATSYFIFLTTWSSNWGLLVFACDQNNCDSSSVCTKYNFCHLCVIYSTLESFNYCGNMSEYMNTFFCVCVCVCSFPLQCIVGNNPTWFLLAQLVRSRTMSLFNWLVLIFYVRVQSGAECAKITYSMLVQTAQARVLSNVGCNKPLDPRESR